MNRTMIPAESRMTAIQVAASFGALCLIWGLAFVVFRVGLRDATPLTFATLRAVLGGIALAGYLIATGRRLPTDRPTHQTAAILGATNVAAFWGLQNLALLRISPGETAVLIYVQPLLVALGAWLFLGERLSPPGILGLLAGFAGVALVVGGRIQVSGQEWIGYLCALAGGVGWAVGTVFFKSRPHQQSLLWIVALQSLYGSVPLATMALLFEQPRLAPTVTLLWTVAYAALASSALAYVIWFRLLRQHAASAVAAFVFLVPLVAVGGDALLLGDRFGFGAVAGAALIVLGIWLVNRPASCTKENIKVRATHE